MLPSPQHHAPVAGSKDAEVADAVIVGIRTGHPEGRVEAQRRQPGCLVGRRTAAEQQQRQPDGQQQRTEQQGPLGGLDVTWYAVSKAALLRQGGRGEEREQG